MKNILPSILITGASGFIGNNLIKKFTKKKIPVLASFNKKKIKKTNLVEPIRINLKNPKLYKLEKYKIHTLIHLAWPDLDDFTNTSHKKNILKNQKNFLKKMITLGCKNIIVAGTCYEYGLINGKINENTYTKPICSLGIGKDNLRNYLQNLQLKYKFKLTWLRLFFIYGINPNRNTLTNLLINNNKKKPIVLNKKIKRDYVDIKYVSKIFFLIFKKNKSFGLVNLSSGRSISLKELVNKIKKKFKIDPFVLYKNTIQRKFEPESFYGCNKKLKKII